MQTTEIEFNIPQESGEVFSYPQVRQFKGLARANAELLAGSGLSLAGMPLRELRRQARGRILGQAAVYTAALGIEAPVVASDALLFATGHQPFLFHPGIWIKHLLVQRLAGDAAAALSIPVDSDAFEEIGADVPVLNGGLRKIHHTLVQVPPDVPFEAQPAPDLMEWEGFLRRLEAALRTLGEPEVEATFQRFVQTASRVQRVDDIGTFLTLVRRHHEGRRRYLEIPASHVSRTPEFRQFFLAILRDSPRFAETYNRHLDGYRERHNVRTAAQPFPNLEHDGSRVELPFWVISDGRRHSMFAERVDRTWQVGTREGGTLKVADSDGPDRLGGIEIRPKALTLTSFTRLCVTDLFVHGVGGGRYDRVTDAVVEDFFNIPPPRYAVVTATLHLPLHEHKMDEERQRLQRRLLEIQHNPERALADPSSEQQQLIDEKWKLIRSLDSSVLTRRERRQVTVRIREINEALARGLGQERGDVEVKLQALTRAPEADAAARYRGYPFCFFPPSALDALIDGLGLDGRP